MLHSPQQWLHVHAAKVCARARLFCFAHAGGPAATFRPWSTLKQDDIELVAIELPGRRSRVTERALTSITEIVELLEPIVAPCLDRPFALFGHSMGAIVAFELSRRLRDEGLPQPTHLYVAGAHAPQLPRAPDLHHLPYAQFLDQVVALGGIPRELADEADLMDMVMPALRADFTAIETWHYIDAPPLAIPITAFGGDRDPRVSTDQLQAWHVQTTADFRCRVFAGGHFFIEEHRHDIVDSIRV